MDDFAFEHDPNALHVAVERAAATEIDLSFRAMFGGIIAYADGRPFASLSNRGLALKLDAKDQAALLELDGARRLRYEPGDPPSKTYVLVPDAMLSDDAALRAWSCRSAAYVAATARKPRAAKSKV